MRLPGVDRGAQRLDRVAHVAERERVVPRQRAFEERARRVGFAVAAPDEHRGGHLVDRQLRDERRNGVASSTVTSSQAPVSIGLSTVRTAPDGTRDSALFARQRDAEPRQQDDDPDQRDAARDQQPRMPPLAHGVRERAAEQDRRRRRPARRRRRSRAASTNVRSKTGGEKQVHYHGHRA